MPRGYFDFFGAHSFFLQMMEEGSSFEGIQKGTLA